MMDIGFHDQIQDLHQGPQNAADRVPRRDVYLIRAYEYPDEWDELSREELRTG